MQIYQIYNKVTQKSYIGKSKDYLSRYEKHKLNAKNKINRRLYDSMNYHGIENFTIILLENVDSTNKQYINEREKYWILELNTIMPNGYNMTSGGDGGNTLEKWTQEEKEKLWKKQASKRIGSKRSPESRAKMSEKAKNRILSHETRKKISQTRKLKGLFPPEETRWKKGQIGAFKGKKHSQYSKSLISKARSGKTYEDLLGNEKAQKRKQELSKNWNNNKNPNYVDFNDNLKNKALKQLRKNKITMNNLSKHIKISPYKIRQWFRSIGISNYQKFSNITSISEWQNFWRSINVN